jgi:MvdD-like protein with pre-ATP grasp domain
VANVVLCVRGAAQELPAVATALRARGVEPIVLDASAFPTAVPVTLAYDRAGVAGRWSELGELRDVSAVWQAAVVGIELPEMAPGVRETCIAASERAVIGLLDSLPAFQLDPRWNQLRADSKPDQLRLARRLGLEIPETIITNDPDAVRAFARRAGPVVAKMLVPPATPGPLRDGEAAVMFTTAMTDDDLAQLDGLDLCPMIFQQRIETERDVRVTIAGKRLFAAAIDASARRGGDPDWRSHSYAHDRAPAWQPCELPRALADRLVQLADRAGLNYAAIDLVARPDGSHVFLELNATGSFAFLGAPHAGAIAAALADVLIDPAARRIPHA